MKALFPSWSDSLLRIGCSLLVLVAVGIPGGLMVYVRSPLYTAVGDEIAQPVELDHRHHVRDDGIDCLYCHADAARAPNAGVPGAQVCMSCHVQVWNQSPLLDPVRTSFFANRPIVWNKVDNLPDYVYFDHAVHVHAGVGCESCHGRVDRMSRVSKAAPMSMGWCLGCHRHPEAYLRPRDQVTVMGYRPKASQLAVGARLVREHHIHPPTYCTGCHR